MRIRIAALIAVFSALLGLAQGVAAQSAETWPTRPIRLVLPSAPGGASDVLARAMAERLGAALKQQVLVDNRPGASGMIATKAVMGARPDGYTLLYTTASATVMAAALKPDLGIDFTKDLVPTAVANFGGVLLLVNREVPARNLKELVALVKSRPGKYAYASWAIGSNGHLTMEWLKSQTGMQTHHVPYKAMTTILTELSTNVVEIAWADVVSALPFIESGRVRAIAVNGATRAPRLPDVPTMGEQGYPFPGTGWQGVFAPVGTPAAIVQRVHAEINKILATQEMKDLMVRVNVDPPPLWTTEQFRSLLVHDLGVWKKIVADGRIKVD